MQNGLVRRRDGSPQKGAKSAAQDVVRSYRDRNENEQPQRHIVCLITREDIRVMRLCSKTLPPRVGSDACSVC